MRIPLRVLILEDQRGDAAIMVLKLQEAGFDPDWQCVETEPDYMACLQSGTDIILADYALPRFDGLRALQRLQEAGLDIPFILVSGAIREEVAVECMRRGAADYLLKDRLARLGAAVKMALVQKHLRDRQRQADLALRESEARYRLLVDASLQGIFIYQEEGIQFANPAMAAIFGYDSPHELIGLDAQRLVVPHDRIRLHTHRAACLQGEPTPERDEYQGTRKDGTLVWIECLGTLVLWEGKPAMLATVLDITERKRAEERENLIQRLQEALANIKQLQGLLPICAHCKKIRNDRHYWQQIESYIAEHSDARFSHGVCPECYERVLRPVLDELRHRPEETP